MAFHQLVFTEYSRKRHIDERFFFSYDGLVVGDGVPEAHGHHDQYVHPGEQGLVFNNLSTRRDGEEEGQQGEVPVQVELSTTTTVEDYEELLVGGRVVRYSNNV